MSWTYPLSWRRFLVPPWPPCNGSVMLSRRKMKLESFASLESPAAPSPPVYYKTFLPTAPNFFPFIKNLNDWNFCLPHLPHPVGLTSLGNPWPQLQLCWHRLRKTPHCGLGRRWEWPERSSLHQWCSFQFHWFGFPKCFWRSPTPASPGYHRQRRAIWGRQMFDGRCFSGCPSPMSMSMYTLFFYFQSTSDALSTHPGQGHRPLPGCCVTIPPRDATKASVSFPLGVKNNCRGIQVASSPLLQLSLIPIP